jgi:hypothetical protein
MPYRIQQVGKLNRGLTERVPEVFFFYGPEKPLEVSGEVGYRTRVCVCVCVCASFSIVDSTFGSVGIKELSTFVMAGLGIGLPLSDGRANEGLLGVRRGKRNQTWALVQWTWPVSMRCSGVRWRLGGFVSSCHELVLSACGSSSPSGVGRAYPSV